MATQDSKTWTKSLLVMLIITCSALMNIVLTRKVSSLENTIAYMRSSDNLRTGVTLPSINVRRIDGSRSSIAFSDSKIPTVLYVFTPQCHWCRENLPELHALIDNSAGRYRVIGISLRRQDLNDYVEKERLHFPIYTDVEQSSIIAYHFGATPETIVVSSDAKLLKDWKGAYTQDQRHEIESYLNIHLPVCICDLNVPKS